MSDVLVTAALPYINNVPHLGHIVGSHLPADIIARYHRLKGDNVNFVGGSDAHGTPALLTAKSLGVPIEDVVDRLHEEHKDIYEFFGISYDNYSLTTSQTHAQITTDFFIKLKEQGFIEREDISQAYCPQEDLFLPDRYLSGTCPSCYEEDIQADQCDNCSYIPLPIEILDPYCTHCEGEVKFKETEQLLFKLDLVSDELESWIESNTGNWRDHVYGEAIGLVNNGLKPSSITRTLPFGISVPSLENQVFYVWFDAPIGYLSFTKEISMEVYEQTWKNPDSTIINFLGKDNIRFHTIWWPGMLMAHGDYILPTNVVGLNFLNFKGEKFSKSRGVGVFCTDMDVSGIDINSLRSYLTTLIPERGDTNFSWKGYQDHVNRNLIAAIGNLYNRVIEMTSNFFLSDLQFQKFNILFRKII